MPVSVLTAVFFPLLEARLKPMKLLKRTQNIYHSAWGELPLKLCPASRKDMALKVSTPKRAALGIFGVSSAQIIKA
jgi:hypothetical protein